MTSAATTIMAAKFAIRFIDRIESVRVEYTNGETVVGHVVSCNGDMLEPEVVIIIEPGSRHDAPHLVQWARVARIAIQSLDGSIAEFSG